MDIGKIMEYLPHRYPFLLVDRIVEMEPLRAVGIKNVSINEPFFQGHFPGEPVLPGVLILEAMGQVAAMMICQSPEMKGMITYVTTIDEAKFRRPVRPGDQLVTTAELTRVRGRVGKVRAVGRVDGQIVASASFGFVLAHRLTAAEVEE